MSPITCNYDIKNVLQVFDTGTAIRGRLKTLAREIIANTYSDVLEAKNYDGGNQLGEQQIVKEQVENALKEGSFLEGGVDNQVCCCYLYVLKPG